MAGAVVLDPARHIPGLADSKVLTAAGRERLYDAIWRAPSAWAVASVQPTEIDAINIHQATLKAMQRAVLALAPLPDVVLVDAFRIPALPMAQRGVIKGDRQCAAIAAASIVAKVTRDRLMDSMHADDPRYGFDRHKGYATAEHLAAVARHGYSAAHRRSFRPPSLFDTLDEAEDCGVVRSRGGAQAGREGACGRAAWTRPSPNTRGSSRRSRATGTAPTRSATSSCESKQLDKGVEQYTRIADHLADEGFYPRPRRSTRRSSRSSPTRNTPCCNRATSPPSRGCSPTPRRRSAPSPSGGARKGDAKGAAETAIRIGQLDPDDSRSASRRRESRARDQGQRDGPHASSAKSRFKLDKSGDAKQALQAFRSAFDLDPSDWEVRERLLDAVSAERRSCAGAATWPPKPRS